MNTAKNILLFFASFVIMGFFVLLIDQMYPTSVTNQVDFQSYSKQAQLLEELK